MSPELRGPKCLYMCYDMLKKNFSLAIVIHSLFILWSLYINVAQFTVLFQSILLHFIRKKFIFHKLV